jgi:hypothetical protein
VKSGAVVPAGRMPSPSMEETFLWETVEEAVLLFAMMNTFQKV